MSPNRSAVRRSVVLLGLAVVGALLVARFPTVSVGGRDIRIPLVLGLICGLLLVPSLVSHYRSGETRKFVQWGLFVIGIPLSVGLGSWLGVVALLLSLVVGLEVDRRLPGRAS